MTSWAIPIAASLFEVGWAIGLEYRFAEPLTLARAADVLPTVAGVMVLRSSSPS